MKHFAAGAGRVVAVTGLHRGESPQPGGAVAESLRRCFPDIKIVGLCYDPLESGIYSIGADRLDATYLMPYPSIGPEALLERLRDIIAREGVNAIIPCLDSELSNYLAIERELIKCGVRCVLPTQVSLDARSKINLTELCRQVKIPALRTFHSHDPATLSAYASQTGYPCYVKGQIYDARVVNNAAELHAAFHEIYRTWGGPVLLQEAASGEEYDFTGLGDGQGGLVAFCTIRKMLRSRLGKGYAGAVVDNPEIEDYSRRLIGELKWNGPFELEFIKVWGHHPVLMEMNPRFPAWIDFPSKLDCNMPVAFLERIYGDPPSPLARCMPGKMFLRHCTDLVGDIAEIARLTEDNHESSARTSEGVI